MEDWAGSSVDETLWDCVMQSPFMRGRYLLLLLYCGLDILHNVFCFFL